MPVTAKLSRKFYDTFGDEIATELVEWFNQVDATYRGDLRELNELNFGRFDAKLEQRVAELDAKIEQRVAELDARIEQRYTQLDAKLEQRIAELDATIEKRYGQLDAKIEQRYAQLDAKVDQRMAELRKDLADMKSDLVRWMFMFWAPTALGVVGTALSVVALLLRR
ncbi:MAG: hypothetical protein DMD55_18700 [Gemmatimonadetes bacterium]|nr:MAG: hypothetical protein DMD55_18700 [Gemmatimonadota bacterium]